MALRYTTMELPVGWIQPFLSPSICPPLYFPPPPPPPYSPPPPPPRPRPPPELTRPFPPKQLPVYWCLSPHPPPPPPPPPPPAAYTTSPHAVDVVNELDAIIQSIRTSATINKFKDTLQDHMHCELGDTTRAAKSSSTIKGSLRKVVDAIATSRELIQKAIDRYEDVLQERTKRTGMEKQRDENDGNDESTHKRRRKA